MSSYKLMFLVISSLCCLALVSSYPNLHTNVSYSRTSRQVQGCILPQHPRFGQWLIYLSVSQPQVGTSVPTGTVLQISCQNGYKLDSEDLIVCINNEWITEIGQCMKTCPSIHNTPVMTVTCTYNHRKLKDCVNAIDGTKAQFRCADFYEDQSLERHSRNVCYNGKWSHNVPECVPICGQKNFKKDPTLIVGGTNVTRGDYPWQVALYLKQSKILICGGSLLNQRVVLTAAHCITDEDGKLASKDLYMVAVGKYFRNYEDTRDKNESQFSTIYDMYIPKQYKGDAQNYFGDIALIITKKTFVLSTTVQPVCVDWALRLHYSLNSFNTTYAYVNGWGFTVEHEKPSEVLKELKVPLITEDKCNERLPKDFSKFLTVDKMCAGYLDSGLSVCKGDTGGLVARYRGRFYVIGVVSVSPQADTPEGGCNSQQYTLYTKVNNYLDSFILDLEARFRPEYNTDCQDSSNKNTPSCSNTTDEGSPKCQTNQFTCSSGQCIDQVFKCDGEAQCDDYSDEILETCWKIICPEFTYKCNYGACVNNQAKCNGIVECFDGSDEDPSICKTTPNVTLSSASELPVGPAPSKGQCILPKHLESGEWIAYADGNRVTGLAPGMSIKNGAVLEIKCQQGYKTEGNNLTFCKDGQWAFGVGFCLRVCPNIASTATLHVTCNYNGKENKDCIDAVDGTLAKFSCASFYEDPSLKKNPVHICRNGVWSHQKPVCEPVCGQKNVDSTTLIINGQNVTKGKYPWQVALYSSKKKELICGGSLINQRMIVTAAHCVSDQATGIAFSEESYTVAVGKYFRSYNDSRDFNEAQFSELDRIFVHPFYKGEQQNFLGDIAILITKKIFVLSRSVQPVCLDRGDFYDPKANNHGYVVGWGFTKEDQNPSDALKVIEVPSVSISTCAQSIPNENQIHLTNDKMCAGYVNKSTAVCKGDSGGGLVFKHDGSYYLTGVVSLSPNSPTSEVEGCNSQTYGLYTKVSTYMRDFILSKDAEFKPRNF